MLHALPPRLAARDGLTRRTLATLADAPACAIPLIDFSCFLHARDAAEKRHTADAIVAGFKQALGFIYLKEHGVSEATIRNVFAKSGEFFSLPTETKDSLRWEDPRAKRGYVAIGREQASQSSDPDEIAKRRASAPDYKETMEIGRDWDATWKNQWPAEGDAPRFKDTMLDFYRTCHGLHVQVMRAIALGLGLGEAFFATLVDQQCHTLRLLSYPPVPTALLRKEGQARVAPHSDYGSITLLFQDAVGRRPRGAAPTHAGVPARSADPRHGGRERSGPARALAQRRAPVDAAPRRRAARAGPRRRWRSHTAAAVGRVLLQPQFRRGRRVPPELRQDSKARSCDHGGVYRAPPRGYVHMSSTCTSGPLCFCASGYAVVFHGTRLH